MTPQAFIAKWRDNALTEKAGAQAHFEDLCELVGVDKPREEGAYQYERGVTRTGAAQGWADVWKKNFHELWSLRLGTSLEDRPRYTPTTTFETFPFPEGLAPRDTQPPSPPTPLPQAGEGSEAIAAAAKRLNALREAWLNPPEWVEWVRTPEEEAAGFPPRPVAKARPLPPAGEHPEGHEGAKAQPATYEAELKKRTLTNLYNARPAWLGHAHRELDATVAAAYGWTDYTPEMPDGEILKRLLALNLARSSGETEAMGMENRAPESRRASG